MAELSPQAQAVLDAFLRTPCDDKLLVAAALRAAALQIENSSDGRGCLDILRQIATELENHP
jgi:hypothetical protein